MIIEGLAQIFINLLVSLFSGLEFVSLPIDMINALYTVICYGTYIVGSDVLIFFCTSVSSWWIMNLTAGIGVYLLELIPFF